MEIKYSTFTLRLFTQLAVQFNLMAWGFHSLDSVPANAIMIGAVSSRKISITWTGADCIPYFVLNVNDTVGTSVTTNDPIYAYDAVENTVYNFSLSSFDFFGRENYTISSLYRFDSELNSNS